ncbi:MAG: ABC transporter permease [Anaerolineae bacterium]|nr:ABC transporter permease [Anaerolineae bacterium]
MKIIDIALNDLTRSFRSAFTIGMAIVAPLMLTGLIYFAFGGLSGGDVSMTAMRVGVVNADTLPADSPLDAPVGDNIRMMFFDESVESWIEARDYPDEASVRAALDKQEIGVAVIIPADLSASLLAGESEAQVTIVSDPTLTIAPAVVQDMVTMMLDGVSGGGIAIQTLMERQQASGLQPDPAQISAWVTRYTDWYRDFQRDLFHNPEKAALVLTSLSAGETESADPIQQMMGLTMAGQMIFFAFFTGAYAMMSILCEDEEGTLARLFTTPTERANILAGKFLAVVLTVILQGLVLMTAGHYAFGIAWGQPGAVALALAGQVIAASGLGVLLIAFVKTSKQGGPVLGGGLTALGMLGGLFTANIPGGMSAAFAMLANFTPQGWVLKGWKLSLAGAVPADLLLPFVVALAMGAVMFAIGAVMFKKRYS